MVTRKRWNYHESALSFHCTQTGQLERLKDNPVDDTDRTVLDAAVKVSEPIEMQNEEKERYRYGTGVTILMCWIKVPAAQPLEGDRLILNGDDTRIRKVKPWPHVPNPAFYELHIEVEYGT